jgi:drug/metabolite transporter (DMT)-like permease
MWSTSGAFTKVLTVKTAFGLHEPTVPPLQIAFFRALFAGLVLVPTLRCADISFRPAMVTMATSFALMNATFVSAMALGTAANAILLQYTAPMWMFLASVWLLHEPADRRSMRALIIGLGGLVVIVVGGWNDDELPIVGLGLASGVAYASVVVHLRLLRDASPRWLTVVNHLASALVLVAWIYSLPIPTPGQLLVLFLYGSLQMALPYWMMAKGVQAVSPQEAGTITLLEPLLNPLWAYLISGERPTTYTLVGGMGILLALAYRYWPRPDANSSSAA